MIWEHVDGGEGKRFSPCALGTTALSNLAAFLGGG